MRYQEKGVLSPSDRKLENGQNRRRYYKPPTLLKSNKISEISRFPKILRAELNLDKGKLVALL